MMSMKVMLMMIMMTVMKVANGDGDEYAPYFPCFCVFLRKKREGWHGCTTHTFRCFSKNKDADTILAHYGSLLAPNGTFAKVTGFIRHEDFVHKYKLNDIAVLMVSSIIFAVHVCEEYPTLSWNTAFSTPLFRSLFLEVVHHASAPQCGKGEVMGKRRRRYITREGNVLAQIASKRPTLCVSSLAKDNRSSSWLAWDT